MMDVVLGVGVPTEWIGPPKAVFSSAWNTVSAGLIASLTSVAFGRLRAADQFTPDCSRRARRSHDGAGAPGAASLAAYRSALQTGRMLPPVAGGLATIVGFRLLHPYPNLRHLLQPRS